MKFIYVVSSINFAISRKLGGPLFHQSSQDSPFDWWEFTNLNIAEKLGHSRMLPPGPQSSSYEVIIIPLTLPQHLYNKLPRWCIRIYTQNLAYNDMEQMGIIRRFSIHSGPLEKAISFLMAMDSWFTQKNGGSFHSYASISEDISINIPIVSHDHSKNKHMKHIIYHTHI